MTDAHHLRAHARWSASSTARNWACPGALTLAEKAEASTSSEAADWGTCAHQIAEKCLRQGVDAITFLDTVERTETRSFTVDEEMADTAQQYVDYVEQRRYEHLEGEWLPPVFIEQRFSLEALNPPFAAGGTADAVIYIRARKELEIVDLKSGRGVVVEATNNPQLRTYALGAMLANPGLDVERVTVTIVQPWAPHKDGRIRSETFHVADLLEWTGELIEAMHHAKQAMDDVGVLVEATWNSLYLNAGDHCKFCPAAGFCPALQQRALDAAGVWFDDSDQARISNTPDAMSPAELAAKLDSLDVIEEWVKALRAYAHAQAERGVEIPGYQLVDKIGNRAWKDEAAAEEFLSQQVCVGIDNVNLFVPLKLKSPAQMEKALGKQKGIIADLVERPVRGTNLVATAKTTRPAAKPTAQKMAEQFYEST